MKNSRTLPCLLAPALACGMAMLHQENPTGRQSEFEAASVHPSSPKDNRPSRISGGPGTADPERLSIVNVSLSGIVDYAYELHPHQASWPPWTDDDSFTIEAKIPAQATKAEFKQMLQNLLLDRFDLKMHTEQRVMPVFRLEIAESGLRMKQSNAPLDSGPRTGMEIGKDGYPILPPGNAPFQQMAPSGKTVIRRVAQTMRELTDWCSYRVGKPVINATGLDGAYDYTIYYDLRAMRVSATPTDDQEPLGPTIFEALDRQLGLKLKPGKASVPFVVIDDARKIPKEN